MDILTRLRQAIGNIANEQSDLSVEGDKSGNDERSKRIQKDTPSSQSFKPTPATKRKDQAYTTALHFRDNWLAIKNALLTPDQAALHHGISRTSLKDRLQDLCDSLVFEANRADEDVDIAGPCMEMLLEGDILGQLVRLTANDRIAGSQQEVVRLFASLIILLDERFLSRQAVHRPLVRLMRICVGDEFFQTNQNFGKQEDDKMATIGINEDEEKRAHRKFGRIGSAEMLGFEEELVDLMCHIASRLRNTPDLLIIFFRERGGDEETRKAFNRAMSGSSATPSSRLSTRAPSPTNQAHSSIPNFPRSSTPNISSPLRPPDTISTPVIGKTDSPSQASSISGALTYDFPLFSYLMRFVHRESRTGELARAGILFLVDVAFAPGRRNLSRNPQSRFTKNSSWGRSSGMLSPAAKSVRSPAPTGGRRSGAGTPQKAKIEADLGMGPSIALARFMVESDFSEVLGAGIGAVYGLLPTKLVLGKIVDQRSGMNENGGGQDSMLVGQGESMMLGEGEKVIASEVVQNISALPGTQSSNSNEVRSQARILCDLLEFTQDIMRTTLRVGSNSIFGSGVEEMGARSRLTNSFELSLLARSLTQSISAALQSLFLENILYPSMLECSDTDGSSIAVMTYLEAMLSVLETESALANCIVSWLTGSEGEEEVLQHNTTQSSTIKPKRKSLAMQQLEKQQSSIMDRRGSTYTSDALGRYTVRDLLIDNLQSSTQYMAVLSALRLATTLFIFHGHFTLSNVIRIEDDPFATTFPTNLIEDFTRKEEEGKLGEDDESKSVSDDSSDEFVYPGTIKDEEKFLTYLHSMARQSVGGYSARMLGKEMGDLLSLISQIQRGNKKNGLNVDQTFGSTGFDNYLDDAAMGLMQDSMGRMIVRYWDEKSGENEGNEVKSNATVDQQSRNENQFRALRHCRRHRLYSQDRLMRTILQCLCNFWQNRPEVNVALTGLLAALSSCPIRSLEGFLCYKREEADRNLLIQTFTSTANEVDEEDDRSDDEKEFEERSSKAKPKPSEKATNRRGNVEQDDMLKAPVLLSILNALIQPVQQWRDSIEDFDKFLDERRRGLLFVEQLNDALKLSGLDTSMEGDGVGQESEKAASPFDVYSNTSSKKKKNENTQPHIDPTNLIAIEKESVHITLPPPPSATPSQQVSSDAESNKAKKDRSVIAERSGFARFFGRSVATEKIDKIEQDPIQSKSIPPPKPFAQHFLQTASIIIDIKKIVKLSDASPWSPNFDPEKNVNMSLKQEMEGTNTEKKVKRTRFQSAGSDSEGEVTFTYPGAAELDGKEKENKKDVSIKMSLSTILDNVIVLEETIKELAAIMQIRKAYGVDAIQLD